MFDSMLENSPIDCGQTLNEPGIYGRLIAQVIMHLDLRSDDVLLDVGCGAGKISLHVAKHCTQVIGIDVGKLAIARALQCRDKLRIENTIFNFGSLEEPCSHIDLNEHNISKILILRTLHHQPDDMKHTSLHGLLKLLKRPGKLVIGDMIFFEPPEQHRDKWDEIHYDGDLTDHPATPQFLADCLREGGAQITIDRLHPLMGVVTAKLE